MSTTDTDRELLELAAKAAGVPKRVVGAAPGYYALYPDRDGVEKFCCMDNWNPLTDDGDALRLAVGLGLHVLNDGMVCIVRTGFPRNLGVMESLSTDPYAATRRAIVRAAAEIGRGMP